MFRTLQVRLTILCIALAVIPLSFIGALLGRQSYQLQQQSALEFERQVTQRAALQVSNFVTHVADQLSLSIQTSDIRNMSHAQQEQLLSEVILTTNGFDELALLDETGHEHVRMGRDTVFSAADLRDRSHEEAIVQALRNNQPYYSEVYFSVINSEPLMTVAVPVVDVHNGRVSGVISGDVRLKPIWDVVAGIKFGEQGAVAITDADGHVAAYRDSSVVLRGTVVDDLKAEGVHPGITGGTVERTSTSFTIGNQTFYAVAELPLAEALGPAYQTVLTTGALLLVTLIVAASLGFVAIRRVVRPVQDLAATARGITAGDLSRDATVTSRDELGDLATAFNAMTAQLRHLLTGLERQVADRTAALAAALNEVQTRAVEQERLLAENASQRETIYGLSVPVLPISTHTLVMPLVGELDGARLQLVQAQALQHLERSSARYLVLDITGVPLVDSQVALGLLAVVQAARLLGAQVMLVGIRPEVAQAIVGLGLDFQSMRTSSDLQTALDRIAVS
jgi:rsbT co-antagonist protein RsbR